MWTPKPKVDFIETATEISEWIERNYGYFVNKNSDKVKIIKDFANQLERLPVDALSFIQQAKNNFIDYGIARPPLPLEFIQELKKVFRNNENDKQESSVPPVYSIDSTGNKYVSHFTNTGRLISHKKINLQRV